MTDESNVVLFSVWSMAGEPMSLATQAQIERAIEKVVKELDEVDGVRLLYTVTKA
ncbi:hypothetical protein KGP36_07125 [Patescibacteria group bacterium]|nr:hypothetical protein [Patescibacteria group bacterium]